VTRGAVLKAAVVGVALSGLTLGIVDCSQRDAPTGIGTVQFGLKLSSGAQIDTVGYLISGNGIPPITGTFDVSRFNTVTSQVTGIPAGKAYKVELSATSVDEKVTCTGSTMVDVAGGMTAQANVAMQCSDNQGAGSVTINGSFDNCPIVTSFTATPSSAPFGGVIALQAKATDLDGDALSFHKEGWTQSVGIGAFDVDDMLNSRTASAKFTCTTVGMTTLTVTVTDESCPATSSLSVSCGVVGSGGASGVGTGGTPASGAGGAAGGQSGGSTSSTGGAVGAPGTGGIAGAGIAPGGAPGSTGGMMVVGLGTGGSLGQGGGPSGSGGGGTASGGATSSGGAGAVSGGTAGMMGAGGASTCSPTHCAGAACDACTYGPNAPLCAVSEEGCGNCPDDNQKGCDVITDPADKKLCEDLYACFLANACVTQGDPLKCWCGTNPTTCVTSNAAPTQANGPCVALVFAGAKSTDAATIKNRFVNSTYPLGAAVNLISCRGTFCPHSCSVP